VPIYSRRPRHRCQRGSRRGVVHAAVRRRDHHPGSAKRNPTLQRCCGRSGDSWSCSARWSSSAASVGARGGSTARRRAARPNSSRRLRRDGRAHIEILAHHGLLLAITRVRAANRRRRCGDLVALRDRRRTSDAPHSENSDSPVKMIHRDNFQDSCDFDGRRTHHGWMRRIDTLITRSASSSSSRPSTVSPFDMSNEQAHDKARHRRRIKGQRHSTNEQLQGRQGTRSSFASTGATTSCTCIHARAQLQRRRQAVQAFSSLVDVPGRWTSSCTKLNKTIATSRCSDHRPPSPCAHRRGVGVAFTGFLPVVRRLAGS